MPLYEGIGLIGDKQLHPVILDIGAAYTKCGFSDDIGPRAIFRTRVTLDGKQRDVFDYRDETDLYRLLVELMQTVYFRRLLVNPKERSVVIVESLLTPTVFRDTLASVLFKHYEVPSCLFCPSHLMALLTLGTQTGLVLDIGYSEAVLIPVYEGVPVLRAWQALPLAGKALQRRVRSGLYETAGLVGRQTSVKEALHDISEAVIEDIKVRSTFVTSEERAGQLAQVAPPPGLLYPLSDGLTLDIPGTLRESAAEVLFTPDADNLTLPTMVLDSLLKCPVDLRRPLAASLLVIGGTAQLPGLKSRLLAQLRRLAAAPPYSQHMNIEDFRLHRPPSKDNYTAWLGGALFGGTDVVVTRSITKDKFLESGRLPDWCRLDSPDSHSRTP